MKLRKSLRQWLTLLSICMGGGTIYKLAYIRDVYYVPMQEAFNATNVEMGLMMTAFAFTCVFCFMPGGWLVDRFPAKYLVAAGLFFTGATGLLLTSIPPMWVVLAAQAIFGVTTTLLFWEAMFKGVRMLGTPDEQGRLFGLLEGGRGLTSTLVSFASLAIFAKLGEGKMGLRGAMIFYSVLLMILGIAALFLMEKNEVEGTINTKEAIKGLIKVCKLPKVWMAGLIVCCGYAFYQGLSYFTPFLIREYGMSQTVGGTVSIIRTYVIAIFCAPLGGMIADKMGSRIKFLQYILGIGAVLATVTIIIPSGSQALPFVVAIMLLLAVVIMAMRGTYYSTTAEISIPLVLSGSALGLISQLGNLPDLFVFTLYGYYLDAYPGRTGYLAVFGTMAAFALAGCILAIILYRMNKKEDKVDYEIRHTDII